MNRNHSARDTARAPMPGWPQDTSSGGKTDELEQEHMRLVLWSSASAQRGHQYVQRSSCRQLAELMLRRVAAQLVAVCRGVGWWVRVSGGRQCACHCSTLSASHGQ